jgi:hypothetical protein
MTDYGGQTWVMDHGIVIEAKPPVDLAAVKDTCEDLVEFGGNEYLPINKQRLEAESWPLSVSSSGPLVPMWLRQAAATVAEETACDTGLPLREATQEYLVRLRSIDGQMSRRYLDVASMLAIESGLEFWETDTTSSDRVTLRPSNLNLPCPDTPVHLFAWALRCGQLMAMRPRRGRSVDQRVLRRTKWAIEAMRRFGVDVPPELQLEPLREVLLCLGQAQAEGRTVSLEDLMWCMKEEWDCYQRMGLYEKARCRAEAWERSEEVEPLNAVREVVVASVRAKPDVSAHPLAWLID